MCYFCPVVASADDILIHSITNHDKQSKLSIRQKIFDEQTGHYAYRSLHFPWTISTLNEYHEKGIILKLDTERKMIKFKRKAPELQKDQNCESTTTCGFDKSTQTTPDETELHRLLKDVTRILTEKGRYQDFVSVLKGIVDNTLTDNIALHLLLDVGNFYSNDSIHSIRYSEETLAFWLTVKKLFKGKGINFFRGFKAQGLDKVQESHIKPKDCRINFAVPSNPILARESSKYTISAENPGILSLSLDAFAENNKFKDVKISIDGKKLALGIGNMGDENLCGHENAPTLQERKQRLATEIGNINSVTTSIETEIASGKKNVSDIERNSSVQKGLLLTISHISKRVKELRELTVKRKLHLENLIKNVEGDWRQSKFANAISYWQTKLLHARTCISDSLETIDKLGYAVSHINGTSQNFISGSKSTVNLGGQSNYICLKEGENLNLTPNQQNSNIIRQRSEKWNDMRKNSRITGSTFFRALGFDTLRAQQEHYDKVYRGIEKPISEHLASLFEYGTTQEINAVGSLVGKILPLYFPNLSYKEDGCIILPFGDTQAVISGDGTGVTADDTKMVAFEFKCPIPDKKHTTDVQYELPVYYTAQVLSQMAAKQLSQVAFISFTPESITFIRGQFDSDLWSKIWKLTETNYGQDDQRRPTKRDADTQQLLTELKTYARKCEFIAEFPSLVVHQQRASLPFMVIIVKKEEQKCCLSMTY